MPHLPSNRKERNEADLERRVERVQHDQRFQWLRTRRARRLLVLANALLLVLIIPSFAVGGPFPYLAIIIAAGCGYWLLRRSVRLVAELPDRFLDERQRQLRDRAYLDAYRIYAWIIGMLATVGLIAFIALSTNDELTFTTQWSQAFSLVMFVLLLAIMLPSMTLAWRDAGESDA
jgi:hypothetical protein